MEVAVPLHDVGTTREPSDLDPRRQETAHDPVFVIFHASDGRAVQEDPDLHAAFGRRRQDGRNPLALERVHADFDCRASGTQPPE